MIEAALQGLIYTSSPLIHWSDGGNVPSTTNQGWMSICIHYGVSWTNVFMWDNRAGIFLKYLAQTWSGYLLFLRCITSCRCYRPVCCQDVWTLDLFPSSQSAVDPDEYPILSAVAVFNQHFHPPLMGLLFHNDL